MYAIRAVIVLLLVLAVIVAYNPRARADTAEIWETIQPAVVEFMDKFYTAVRNLVDGNDSEDEIDDTPVPSPGANFDRIVTLNRSFSF
jgi:hypothetical protein